MKVNTHKQTWPAQTNTTLVDVSTLERDQLRIKCNIHKSVGAMPKCRTNDDVHWEIHKLASVYTMVLRDELPAIKYLGTS